MDKRLAIVTGAGGGIGRAISISLAKAGMNVVIHYNNNKEKAEETAKLCEKEGAETLIVQGNLSDKDACKNVVEQGWFADTHEGRRF